MSTSARLLRALDLLSVGLDGDLVGSLDALSQASAVAVPSYLGLRVVVRTATDRLELTWGPSLPTPAGAPIDARTSLLLRLPGVSGGPPVVEIVLYAGRPGALVDLAADLSWLVGGDGDGIVLDRHHIGAVTACHVAQVEERSTIEQAVGVLVESGLGLDEARALLHGPVAGSPPDPVAAARRVIAGLPTSGPPPSGTGDA